VVVIAGAVVEAVDVAGAIGATGAGATSQHVSAVIGSA
jgi:hypothetical protein